MSGIFGLINLKGAPVSPEIMQAMQNAMANWGLDKKNIWNDGPAGLGSLLTFDTPEATQEHLPTKSPHTEIYLTAEARLDNRDELSKALDIAVSEAKTITDSELILCAYEKWNQDCVTHLIGDWSFAVWHPAEKKLFLARDHSGNTSLYYYADAHRFAFASARQALFALGIPRQLNELYLAQMLVSWPAYHGFDTIELSVHRLPPAHAMIVSDQGIKTWRYWRLEDTPELYLKNSQDYVDGLLEVYGRAVRDRIRSFHPVGVTLSGGLDSGSTSVLAARELGKAGKHLMAFTSVPVHDVSKSTSSTRFGNELALARRTAEFAGNIDLFEIPAKDTSPLDGIRRGLEILAEPGHAASNFFWIFSLYKEAKKQGVGVMLTGQGGNASISWNGAKGLIELLRAREWKKLFLSLVPASSLRAYRSNFRLGAMDWNNTAIHPDFAGRMNLAQLYASATGDITVPEPWNPPLKQRFSILLPGRSFLGALHAEMGAAFGLDVRDATLDKRVLEYCISVPDREYRGPQQTDRWLIRSAMQGLLPDEVRLNRQRGLQSADLGWRLLDCPDEVEQAIKELRDSNLANKYLSLERIQNVWAELKKEVNRETTHKSITILTRGLMAGLYLAALEKGNNH